jgi:glycosyltransferase involved in cell wall biosynthesis
MNKGVLMATGDYFLFLGSDDTLLVDLAQISPLLRDSSTIYYGDVLFKQSGKRYDGEFGAFKLAIKNICHQAICYPAGVFKKFNFELEYKLLADHALNIKLFGSEEFSYCYVPHIIARYNQTGASGSMFDQTYISARMKLIYENFNLFVYLYAKLRMLLAKYFLRKSQYQIK